MCVCIAMSEDVVMAYAIAKGPGSGVTVGLHQDTDVFSAEAAIMHLNVRIYPQLRFLHVRYVALSPDVAMASLRFYLRDLPQSPWGDYNRTFTCESTLQLVFDRLSVPLGAAARVPPIDRTMYLAWVQEPVQGATWNYSKPIISYPPLTAYPPGEEGTSGGAGVAVGSLTCDALTANTLTVGLTTASPGAQLSNVSSVLLPTAGDHSQAWCRVTGGSPFSGSLLVGGDANTEHYLPCLTSTTAAPGGGLMNMPLSRFANGVGITPDAAPTASHSISLRALNSSGVYEVTTAGTVAGGAAYCVKGAVVYSGTSTSNSTLQLNFTAPVDVKFGMQQLKYT